MDNFLISINFTLIYVSIPRILRDLGYTFSSDCPFGSASPLSSSATTSLFSSSFAAETFATAAIESSFLKLISFTPWVFRPITRKEETSSRIVNPERLIIIRLSSSVTSINAIRLPVFSVILMVLTPLPPRLVIR